MLRASFIAGITTVTRSRRRPPSPLRATPFAALFAEAPFAADPLADAPLADAPLTAAPLRAAASPMAWLTIRFPLPATPAPGSRARP